MFIAFAFWVSLLIVANQFSLMGKHMFDHKVLSGTKSTLDIVLKNHRCPTLGGAVATVEMKSSGNLVLVAGDLCLY